MNHIEVNPDEKDIWNRQFNVTLNPLTETMHVYANCASDALDEAADYAEEQGWMGYFLDQEDLDNQHEDDVCYVGNHGLPMLSHEIHIVDVTERS